MAQYTLNWYDLGSLRFTLVCLSGLLFAVAGALYGTLSFTAALWFPLVLLTINLGVAIATQPGFRVKPALMIFHLSLLGLILLAGGGRLFYLSGEVEVSSGQPFEGELHQVDAGPMHPGHLREVRFVNEGFTVDFKGGRRINTFNQVSWVDASGRSRTEIIGDNTPLIINGYKFFVSPNNGFAPTFMWHPADGTPPQRGDVHLPAYPILKLEQAQSWRLPGGRVEAWITIDHDQELIPKSGRITLRPPEPHRLVLRVGEIRHELTPGESVKLPGGLLRYEGLNTWMGYVVYYDPTEPWMLATALLATVSLIWHLLNRVFAGSWKVDDVAAAHTKLTAPAGRPGNALSSRGDRAG